MTPTILIYNDRDSKTCSSDISIALHRIFTQQHTAIVQTDRHHLARNIMELCPSIIILPEIMGEESFYSRHIPIETRTIIKRHVKKGAMLISFCAAAYWMGETITYHPPKGETKFRKGSEVFNAAAIKSFGPIAGYWRLHNGQETTHDCIPVPVSTKTINGWQNETLWYGNGPAFYPIKNTLPKNLEILAKYNNIEDLPIAAFSLPYGEGHYLASGVLPHYHVQPVAANNLLWRVISHRMHQQLFANPSVNMICRPT